MKRLIRTSLVAIALTAAFAQGGWTVHATQGRREGHPVLQNSIHQIEAIKDRLQKAPSDFGGHTVAAIEALNHAVSELHQAIQFDKK